MKFISIVLFNTYVFKHIKINFIRPPHRGRSDKIEIIEYPITVKLYSTLGGMALQLFRLLKKTSSSNSLDCLVKTLSDSICNLFYYTMKTY